MFDPCSTHNEFKFEFRSPTVMRLRNSVGAAYWKQYRGVSRRNRNFFSFFKNKKINILPSVGLHAASFLQSHSFLQFSP